jgi:hypothetical protein
MAKAKPIGAARFLACRSEQHKVSVSVPANGIRFSGFTLTLTAA